MNFTEEHSPTSVNAVSLFVWLIAGVVAFLPFAFHTSPWDAVTLHVPGNQGNWWHALVGVPFFLAYPAIWLRLRPLFSTQISTPIERRLIWIAAGLSSAGTVLVETPFLLHLAGTSAWQRLSVLSLGFGILVGGMILLFAGRRRISPTRKCMAALNAVYLANAALCLVVYSQSTGGLWSRSGWLISVMLFWPLLFELVWLLLKRSAHGRIHPDRERSPATVQTTRRHLHCKDAAR